MAQRGRPRKNPLPEPVNEGEVATAEPEVTAGGVITAGSEDNPLIQTSTQPSLPLDTARRPGPEPPATAVRDYDDLVRELKDLEEMTDTRGWRTFYGNLLSARDGAKENLLTAEKMNDVVKAQATVNLVESLVKRLTEPVERINELRGRFPLFDREFVYSGELDAESGRVVLVHHESKNGATQDAAADTDPSQETVEGAEAETAVPTEAATEVEEGEGGPEPAAPPADNEGPADDADDGPADEDGDDGEEGDEDEDLTDDELEEELDDEDDDPFGE